MPSQEQVYGLWAAKKIDGLWCVGKAGAMEQQADAAMVFNSHDPSMGDGVLAMSVARALSKLPLLPPPYDA